MRVRAGHGKDGSPRKAGTLCKLAWPASTAHPGAWRARGALESLKTRQTRLGRCSRAVSGQTPPPPATCPSMLGILRLPWSGRIYRSSGEFNPKVSVTAGSHRASESCRMRYALCATPDSAQRQSSATPGTPMRYARQRPNALTRLMPMRTRYARQRPTRLAERLARHPSKPTVSLPGSVAGFALQLAAESPSSTIPAMAIAATA